MNIFVGNLAEVAEESKAVHSAGHTWTATFSTFATQFLVALSVLVPVLLLERTATVVASVAWGLTLLTLLSHVLARDQGIAPWKVIGEHLLIAVVVIAATYAVGVWVAATFP